MDHLLKGTIAAVVATSAISSVPIVSNAQTTVSYTKVATNLYKTASKKTIVMKLKKGMKVTVKREGGGWTQVEYGHKKGYILTSQLTTKTKEDLIKEQAIKKGDKLQLKVNLLNRLAKNGNVDEISNTVYMSLSSATNNYADYVDTLSVSKSVRDSLTEKYVDVAFKTLQRYKYEMQAWEQIVKANSIIRENGLDSEVEKFYNKANKSLSDGYSYREENNIEDIPSPLLKAIQKGLKDVKNRDCYHTLEELRSNGNKFLVVKDAFAKITPSSSYAASNNEKYTNGYVTTTKYIPVSGTSRYFELEYKPGEFSRVSMKIALGKYWNTHKLPNNVSINIAGVGTKTLKQNDAPLEIDAKFNARSTSLKVTLPFGTSRNISDIAFTNIKLYR